MKKAEKFEEAAARLREQIVKGVFGERGQMPPMSVLEVAGMLHPDLVDADPTQTYLESLSEKCARLYPQEK